MSDDLTYLMGLDLGQSQDYTALAIAETRNLGPEAVFHFRHLQRWPLGTAYPQIVTELLTLLRRAPLVTTYTYLMVDGTGVGAPVVDMLRRELAGYGQFPLLNFQAVTITGGEQENEDGQVRRVPKRNLVGSIQVALQTNRLKIAASLREAATLTAELQNFQVKITENANDTYGAWRSGTHDDLVLAVALAVWRGQSIGVGVFI